MLREASGMRRAAFLSGLALLALGCTESAEQNTFIVRVSSINDGSPLLADVLRFNEQDSTYSVPVDVVPVEFTNKVYSSGVITDPGTFSYDFHLRRYVVTWRRTDGGPTSGPGWQLSDFDFEGATSEVIPVNSRKEVGILLATVEMKSVDPFASLAFGGAIPLTADIDFVGSPAIDPDEEIHLQASLSVSFANFADEDR